MGSGASSIPMQIDKETFRALSGGALNDAIFDANSVAGIMVTDTQHIRIIVNLSLCRRERN